MKSRQQTINHLLYCSEAEADRINDRLQQCNVRVLKTDGSVEQNFTISTRLQLVRHLQDDSTIESVEYQFNGKWIKIS